MARNEQEPVEKPGSLTHVDKDGGKAYDHPAFGQIGVSRASGHTTLYDSDFEHDHFMTIRIHRSQLQRDLSRDWHYPKEELIEVALSEAQWATFVSSPNQGSGVPCTIRYVGREEMPGIPLRRQKSAFDAELTTRLNSTVKTVDRAIAEVEGEIGSALSAKKKSAIIGHLRRLRASLADSIPWVAKSFDEHMEKTVERGKVEIHAYVNATVQRAGLAAPLQITEIAADTDGPGQADVVADNQRRWYAE